MNSFDNVSLGVSLLSYVSTALMPSADKADVFLIIVRGGKNW